MPAMSVVECRSVTGKGTEEAVTMLVSCNGMNSSDQNAASSRLIGQLEVRGADRRREESVPSPQSFLVAREGIRWQVGVRDAEWLIMRDEVSGAEQSTPSSLGRLEPHALAPSLYSRK